MRAIASPTIAIAGSNPTISPKKYFIIPPECVIYKSSITNTITELTTFNDQGNDRKAHI
ncbi:hypothetical protein Cl131_gp057 [Aphanizomenon phage vB_AphaS-CL131]|nr:hypothetical protein Cl131_gp057 [Aphanizomenon phage vB_AphaS-CL131]